MNKYRNIIIVIFLTFIQTIVLSQSVIQPSTYDQKGKIYLNKWIEAPVSVDQWGNPTPDKRRLLVTFIGPKNLGKGTKGNFYVEITPENWYRQLSDPNSEFISSADLSLIANQGAFEFGPKPIYKEVIGNDNKLENLTDISDFWRTFYLIAGISLQNICEVIPYLGQALAVSNAAGSLIEWKNTQEPDWIQIWNNDFENDIYPLPNPRHVKEHGFVRKYVYEIPFKYLTGEGELFLRINNITVKNQTSDQGTFFHDHNLQVISQLVSTPVKMPIVDKYTGTQSLPVAGLCDFKFDYKVDNNLIVNISSLNKSKKFFIRKIELALQAKRGTLKVKGIPSISDMHNNLLKFQSYKSLSGRNAFKDMVLMGASISFFNSIAGYIISGTTATIGTTDGIKSGLSKMSFSKSIEAQWHQQNYFDIFYIPQIKKDLQYKNIQDFVVEIPLDFYTADISKSTILNGNFTVEIIGSNDPYYSGTTQFMEIPFHVPLVKKTKKDKKKTFIGFILDSSGSMSSSDPKNIRKSAVNQILDLLAGNEDVFIVDFDDKAKWLNKNDWNNWDLNTLKKYVNSVNADGGTDLGAGLEAMKEALKGRISDNAYGGVLMFTDGKGKYNNEASWFQQHNIPVHTISYTKNGDATTMSKIANTTGGIYLQANNEQDVIAALSNYFNNIVGYNMICAYTNIITQGQSIEFRFYMDYHTEEVVQKLSWNGSKIGLKLIAPDGSVYREKQSGEWFTGANYTSAKLLKPKGGMWKAVFTGVQIPAGGEKFRFEVSGDTPSKFKLKNKSMPNGQLLFSLQEESNAVNINNINPKIIVETPKNKKVDISGNYRNGSFSFLPRYGEGNYNVNMTFEALDATGNPIQREFRRSVLVGNDIPSFVATVDDIMGNVITTQLGKWTGNQEGITCYIYSPNSTKANAKAKGIVTFVQDKVCQINIVEYLGGAYQVNMGDIVELDIVEWQNDH